MSKDKITAARFYRPSGIVRRPVAAALCIALEKACDRRTRALMRDPRKLKRLRKIVNADYMGYVIHEARAMGEHGTMEGNNFVGVQRQLMVDGTADEESIKLLYGWFGNIITAMGQRYKRGNKTMRLGISIMARGRRALASAWRRWVRWKKVKFEGDELADFDDAFDLGTAFTPSLSKFELREAFRMSDARLKRFAKRAPIATYMTTTR